MIEDEFRLEEVNPSPAFFDEKKLRAFNGEYIRALPVAEFVAACQPWLTGTDTIAPPPWQPEEFDAGRVRGGRAAGADPDRGAQRDRAERRLPLPRRAR